jgi:hypothetical protein
LNCNSIIEFQYELAAAAALDTLANFGLVMQVKFDIYE